MLVNKTIKHNTIARYKFEGSLGERANTIKHNAAHIHIIIENTVVNS